MKKIAVLTLIVLVILVSCAKKGSPVRNEGIRPGVFGFAYSPYEKLAVADRQLYTYIFNIIRNKLVYYVQKTLTNDPEPIGMVIELDSAAADRPNAVFQDAVQAKAVRAWNVFDTDVIPIPDEDVDNYNAGSVDQQVVLTPKASFAVRYAGANATVYVKYWILQYWNYNFVHYLVRTTNWSIVRTDVLE